MATPKRIQRQRTKGWRMPANTVYVGRPSQWGNPYPLKPFTRDEAVRLFRNSARGVWSPSDCPDRWLSLAYRRHTEWLRRFGRGWHPTEAIQHVLRGLDLACWCPLDEPCHADVLLELANQ
jgi:hypothetical protein